MLKIPKLDPHAGAGPQRMIRGNFAATANR
jgi:hypothetical protein